MAIRIIGVVGAGVMGSGVAQNLAQTGHQVVLLDLSSQILDRAKREITENIRLHALFADSEQTDNPDEILERITFSTEYQLLSNVDFVIENVTEKWEIKKEVYTQLSAICPDRCVFAANTSAIPITRLASVTNREPKVIGMHFMNPVPLKTMVEVIRGLHTSNETVDTAKELLERWEKKRLSSMIPPDLCQTVY